MIQMLREQSENVVSCHFGGSDCVRLYASAIIHARPAQVPDCLPKQEIKPDGAGRVFVCPMEGKMMDFDMRAVTAEVLAKLEERMKNPPRRGIYAQKIEPAKTRWDRFDAIRSYYTEVLPLIMSSPPNQWPMSCHEVEWPRLMTPIELALWSDIRTYGVVLFPQFPVGRYFVDFGHPVYKIAVECDGAAYHKDKAREARRTADIESLGWTIYRLKGRECVEPDPDPWDDDQTPAMNVQLLKFLCSNLDISYGPLGRTEP